MTPQEFIDVIRLVVRDAAVRSTLSVIEHPPGRKPSQELREMAEWFQSLDADSRRQLSQVIALAVDAAVFGFLCVLDGVRAVEHVPPSGQFELRYVKDDLTLLNPDGLMLHDLYNAPSTILNCGITEELGQSSDALTVIREFPGEVP